MELGNLYNLTTTYVDWDPTDGLYMHGNSHHHKTKTNYSNFNFYLKTINRYSCNFDIDKNKL